MRGYNRCTDDDFNQYERCQLLAALFSYHFLFFQDGDLIFVVFGFIYCTALGKTDQQVQESEIK